jgi:transcriptional regulator with PAS, ATPase and Fis domain
MQSKLLRVLQDGAVRRVGADRERSTDVRVLVATNRDLEQEVASGRFRTDLFFRLNTFVLEVPPLRDRHGDLEALVRHFVDAFSRDAGKRIERVAVEVLDRLGRYTFPGNVRELENIVEHAVTFCTSDTVVVDHLPVRVRRQTESNQSASGAQEVPAALIVGGELLSLDEVTRRYIRHMLKLTAGNKRRAASLLGISRQTLYRHLGRDES